MSDLTIVCAWCCRVRLPSGRWTVVPVEPDPEHVSHGICEECSETYMDELRRAESSGPPPAA